MDMTFLNVKQQKIFKILKNIIKKMKNFVLLTKADYKIAMYFGLLKKMLIK